MKTTLLHLSILAFASAGMTGCGPNLEAHCKSQIEILCAQMHACAPDQSLDQDNDGTPDFEEEWGADPEACVTMRLAGFTFSLGGAIFSPEPAHCEEKTPEGVCSDPARPSYDGKAAKTCLADLESQSCDDFNNAVIPEACALICTE